MSLTVISLGAGVQSTTLALLAAQGELNPMPDCAIFADTGAEPAPVYRHVDWLSQPGRLPFPVHRVTVGNLAQEIRTASEGEPRNDGRPPFFIKNAEGRKGMLHRQCTQDYKIRPIEKEIRRLLGLRPRQRWPKELMVEQWLGISRDEMDRMSVSLITTIKKRYPLIELGWRRYDCLLWLERQGYPRPPKRACTFCPFRSDDEWRWLKEQDPSGWEGACEIDAAIRKPAYREVMGLKCEPYLHSSLRPLKEVDLSIDDRQGNLWGLRQECTGVCGV